MRKTRTALLADERLLQESSFSLSFCLTVLVSQPVRLAALQRHDPDDEVASGLCTTFDADTPDGERLGTYKLFLSRIRAAWLLLSYLLMVHASPPL